ncbi:MAG TPA: hypothetical protein VF297_24750 [Pyrinomonadaceae bacterium]
MSADPYSMLLESYAAGSAGGAGVEQLLARMGEDDPRVSLVSKYLASRREADEAEAEEAAASASEAAAAEAEKQAAVRSLRRMARSMYAELEELRGRNDMLAAALGACYLCWGENATCEICAGAGAPGAAPPDGELFREVVVPALRRVQRRRVKPAPPAGGPAGRAFDSNENPN